MPSLEIMPCNTKAEACLIGVGHGERGQYLQEGEGAAQSLVVTLEAV